MECCLCGFVFLVGMLPAMKRPPKNVRISTAFIPSTTRTETMSAGPADLYPRNELNAPFTCLTRGWFVGNSYPKASFTKNVDPINREGWRGWSCESYKRFRQFKNGRTCKYDD